MATTMTIYSWNMLYRNHESDRAFDFIANTPFDIFCLQEVSEAFLKRLQALPYHLAYRTEVDRELRTGVVRSYIVTLSKYPITAKGEIPFPEYWHLLPLRTRLFVRLMPDSFFSKISNRGGLYTDVKLDTASVRVFNLHLILAQPAWRLREFELAMAERDRSHPTIVCGDFNTIEAPHISILNWLLGGTAGDIFLHSRERTTIEKRFVEHELQNAHRGLVTHQLSRSQLDHILVSHSFTITSTQVHADRRGSDHHPISADIAFS